MALHNSNVLALLNSYNAGKIAENSSRQALAAEESAAASRYIAGQLDQSLQLQQRQAEMQHMMLESAAKQNRQLNALRQELSEVGFAIEGLGSDIRAQTDLHKQHYDEVKKEKKLKEVLYNFEKYLDGCDKENDKLSAAYGSKKTAEMINATGFTTADLSDKADKKDYDALVARANATWSSLSDAEKEELASIEKMYFSYRELKSVNIDQIAAEEVPLLPLEKLSIANAPQPPKFREPELHPALRKVPNIMGRASEIIHTDRTHKKLRIWAALAAVPTVVALYFSAGGGVFEKWFTTETDRLPVYAGPQLQGKKIGEIKKGEICTNLTNEKDFNNQNMKSRELRLSSGVQGWVDATKLISTTSPQPLYTYGMWSIILGFGGLSLYLFIRLSLLEIKFQGPLGQIAWAVREHQALVEKAKVDHQARVAEYEATIAALSEKERTEASRVGKINSEIEEKNAVLLEKRKKIQENHAAVLEDLKVRVNDFLTNHKGMQEFLPRLS